MTPLSRTPRAGLSPEAGACVRIATRTSKTLSDVVLQPCSSPYRIYVHTSIQRQTNSVLARDRLLLEASGSQVSSCPRALPARRSLNENSAFTGMDGHFAATPQTKAHFIYTQKFPLTRKKKEDTPKTQSSSGADRHRARAGVKQISQMKNDAQPKKTAAAELKPRQPSHARTFPLAPQRPPRHPTQQ